MTARLGLIIFVKAYLHNAKIWAKLAERGNHCRGAF